jgi:hypothetical protein
MNYYIMTDIPTKHQYIIVTDKVLEKNYDVRLPDVYEVVKYIFGPRNPKIKIVAAIRK